MDNDTQKNDVTIYPADEDWVNYSVDIHDGWADDVALIYPESSWKPDDGELTTLPLELEEYIRESVDTSAEKEESPTSTNEKPKTHYFRTFLIIWLGTIAIVIAYALGYFYDFLDSYEQAYQASRPYHTMDDVMQYFYEMDMDTVYQMQTSLPEITQFETEDNVREYMADLLDGKIITYENTAYYNDDFPEYHILADGYVVATVALRKSQTDHMDYDFPVWYVSSFEFYTQPLEEFKIEVPENFSVYVNGIELTNSYYVNRTSPDENRFVEPYTVLPDMETYYGNGLYLEPTVTVINNFGTEYVVLPIEDTNEYIIPYPSDCGEAEEMQAFAVEAVTTYANYISNDTPANALDPYFPADSILLPLIKANTSRQYYTSHYTPEIQNVEIRDFIVYDEDTFYCEVYLEQSMVLSWGRDPEIVPTDGHFYFVRIDGEWKVSSIAY